MSAAPATTPFDPKTGPLGTEFAPGVYTQALQIPGATPAGAPPTGTENAPGVQTATSQPGMMSALGMSYAGGPGGDPTTGWTPLNTAATGVPPPVGTGAAPMADPTTGLPVTQPTPVPQPPAVGTGDAASGGAAAPAGGSFDYSSILGMLFGPASGGSSLSGLGTFAGLGALGMFEANQAQQSNQQTIQPITQVGQPLVDAGTGLMNQFKSGTLTPAAQQVVNTSQTQGQNLVQAATPVGQIAQGLFQQYQSGNLKPADQAQLDAQTNAAKQQVLQALGPNADSTMRATYFAEIDNQALMTKNQMLNSYLSTGNTQFDQWAQTTEAGQQLMLDGQKYAVTQLDQTFQQALEASSLGGSDILAGIQLAVNSNTEIANALQSYMGNLAKAYALSKAGGAPRAAASTTAASSLVSQGANAAKNLFSSGTDTAAGGALPTLTDTTGLGVPSMVPDVAGGAEAMPAVTGTDLGLGSLGTDIAGLGASNVAGTGLAAAGGVADAVGGSAATDLAATELLPSTEAALGGGGAALGLGAEIAGGLGAAAAIAGPLIGAFSAPVSLGPEYWNKLETSLTTGVSGNSTYDKYDSPAQQKAAANQELWSIVGRGDFGRMPKNLQQYAIQIGMANPDGTLNQSYVPMAPPTPPSAGGGGGGNL